MYVSTQDHFTVELPGKPTITSHMQKASGVSATSRNYTVKSSLTNVVVTATTLNTTSSRMESDVARGIVIGLMRRIGGKPGTSRKATYSGRTGMETRFQTSDNHFGAVWTVETPGKVYSLTILGVKAPPIAEAKRLFTSFHFR